MSLSALHCYSLTWSTGSTVEQKGHQTMGGCAKDGTGTKRSEVQSFIGIDYVFRLGPSPIPHPAVRHRAHLRHEPHSVLAPHAEPGIFCPCVFHLTPYNSPSPAPGRAPSQHEGQDLPARGLGIKSCPVCFLRQRRGFLASEPPCQCLCLPVVMASNYLL